MILCWVLCAAHGRPGGKVTSPSSCESRVIASYLKFLSVATQKDKHSYSIMTNSDSIGDQTDRPLIKYTNYYAMINMKVHSCCYMLNHAYCMLDSLSLLLVTNRPLSFRLLFVKHVGFCSSFVFSVVCGEI